MKKFPEVDDTITLAKRKTRFKDLEVHVMSRNFFICVRGGLVLCSGVCRISPHNASGFQAEKRAEYKNYQVDRGHGLDDHLC